METVWLVYRITYDGITKPVHTLTCVCTSQEKANKAVELIEAQNVRASVKQVKTDSYID